MNDTCPKHGLSPAVIVYRNGARLTHCPACVHEDTGCSESEAAMLSQQVTILTAQLAERDREIEQLQHRRNFLEQNETVVWEILKIADGSTIHDAVDAITAKDREIDRLRAALEKIADWPSYRGYPKDLVRVATAALAQQEEP